MRSARIRVAGLSKAFGGVAAVDDVSLDVGAGTTLALLGPSGCGKTTLLRLLAGLEVADAGSVHIDEDEVVGRGRHVPPERRRVGMVFQEWALFPHLDVAANVAYGLTRAQVRAGRVTEVLDLVRLAHLAGRRPHELSGGQAQRVAVARALAPQPRVLLFDEPFSSLDRELRVRLRGEVAALLREVGATAVFVTHDQEEAFAVADRVAVMDDGRVVQVGTPAEVYEAPASPWVAGFVGQANLLLASARAGSAATAVGPVPLRSEPAATAGRCRVLVRPEHLALAAAEVGARGTDGGRDAGREAEVVAVDFHGHDTSYRLRVGEDALLARLLTAPRFRPGDRVRVRYTGPATVAYADVGAEPTPPAAPLHGLVPITAGAPAGA